MANLILTLGFASPFVYLVPYVTTELGCSPIQAASLLSVAAVGDCVSRPLCGALLSRAASVRGNFAFSAELFKILK